MHTYLIILVKKVSAYSFFSLKLQTEMMITKAFKKISSKSTLNCAKFNSVLCSYSS